MRRLGSVVSLLLVVLGGIGVQSWVGVGSHCSRPAAGHHGGSHAAGHGAPAAGNLLDTPAECAHCPADQCAASSMCSGGAPPQLPAALPTLVLRPAAGPAASACPGVLRSISATPPTPPPQALA